MKIQTVNLDMALLGAQFALMDSVEQAAFFHGLAAEMEHYPSVYQGQLQFAQIGRELTKVDKMILDNFLPMLAPERA